ncbi:MAG TPA: hypothetical protein DIT49_01370 [Clostridiales bacterium]|nr:hypothetical protein [Clostridiales bacterium]
MEKKLDLRVQKTRAALAKALHELMCQKSWDEITVTELCQRAMIRKATFYKHFGDKTELLIYIIQELKRISFEEVSSLYDSPPPHLLYTMVFQHVMDFIEENEPLVINVLHSKSNAFLRSVLEDDIRREISRHIRQEEPEDVRASHAMLSAIYAGAIVSCGVWWVTQKDRPPKEEIVEQFTQLITRLYLSQQLPLEALGDALSGTENDAVFF